MSPDLLADLKRLHLKLTSQPPLYADQDGASAWTLPTDTDDDVSVTVHGERVVVRVGDTVTEIARKTVIRP